MEPMGETQFVGTQAQVTELTEAMESLIPKEMPKKPIGKAAEVTETLLGRGRRVENGPRRRGLGQLASRAA